MSELGEVVQAARNGRAKKESRQQAFAELVSQFYEIAFRWAFSRLHDADLAQDAVQEAFVVAYQKLEQLQEPEAFAGWFKQIVLSQTYRLLRDTRPLSQAVKLSQEIMDSELGPLALIENDEFKARVMTAVQALPEKEQEVTQLFYLSGSSLLTLGYASVNTVASKLLEFSEAMIGLVLIAMLIAYLPTMYSAFSRRETAVVLWESRAGSPPTVAEMVSRSYRTGELERLRDVWMSWQTWFAELEESHTSLSPLVFFRSPQPQRSWITAAGSVMDSAAFILAAVDVPFDPQAAFCIRSGFLALRQIADFFKLPHESNPRPDMPISISRYEFDKVCQELVAQNVPIRADRDLAWKNFVGWRVNYDDVLLRLAALTSAPYAPWVSDRSALIRTAKRKP